MEVDPDQRKNLLSSVNYGKHYGPFLRFVKQQEPEVFPLVQDLDTKLSTIMAKMGGSRQPVWSKE